MMVPWDMQNEDERRKTVASAKRAGVRHPHPAWRPILEAARALGWPSLFEADLYVHDRRTLVKTPHDQRFVWAIGPTGTHILWGESRGWMQSKTASYVRAVADMRPEFFAWDGKSLQRTTAEDAIVFLTEQAEERS